MESNNALWCTPYKVLCTAYVVFCKFYVVLYTSYVVLCTSFVVLCAAYAGRPLALARPCAAVQNWGIKTPAAWTAQHYTNTTPTLHQHFTTLYNIVQHWKLSLTQLYTAYQCTPSYPNALYCTLCTVNFTFHTVSCTLYHVPGSFYSVYCTLYSVNCTLYTVQCKLYIVHCTV